PTSPRLQSQPSVAHSRSGVAFSTVLLIGDVCAPGGGFSVFGDLNQRQVGHESLRRGAVPVILAGFEDDAAARADLFHRGTATLHATDALRDVDGLTVGMRVPGGARAGGETDAARVQA